MLFWSDFRVRSQKMMEDMKENQDMLLVTPRLSSADIIGNHVPDSTQTVMVLMHEIGGKCGCGDLKDLKRKEIAEAAVADFEKAKTLANARTSVETQVAKWDKQLGLTPEQPATIGDAIIQAEIRSHLASLKAGDRMAFIDAHATEVAAALLAAPCFLSGLTSAELGIVKQRIEVRANPELAKAKAETTRALADAEAGWGSAVRQISERAGLGKPLDGIVQRAVASIGQDAV
jgi:hypothetical protein